MTKFFFFLSRVRVSLICIWLSVVYKFILGLKFRSFKRVYSEREVILPLTLMPQNWFLPGNPCFWLPVYPSRIFHVLLHMHTSVCTCLQMCRDRRIYFYTVHTVQHLALLHLALPVRLEHPPPTLLHDRLIPFNYCTVVIVWRCRIYLAILCWLSHWTLLKESKTIKEWTFSLYTSFYYSQTMPVCHFINVSIISEG